MSSTDGCKSAPKSPVLGQPLVQKGFSPAEEIASDLSESFPLLITSVGKKFPDFKTTGSTESAKIENLMRIRSTAIPLFDYTHLITHRKKL